MTVTELFQSGKLQETIQALGEEVRNFPLDTRRRTFLFELLCFAGDYARAEKHLDILAAESRETALGSLLYRSAIHADRTRQDMFANHACPPAHTGANSCGLRAGIPFRRFTDADERIGTALEVFVAGSYTWIALEHIASIEIPRPQRLRDLLWTPAYIATAPAYSSLQLGEVLLPVLSALSWKHPDDQVRLGRSTVWEEDPSSGWLPYGQKMFLIDGEEVPILELGKIEFSIATGLGRAASA